MELPIRLVAADPLREGRGGVSQTKQRGRHRPSGSRPVQVVPGPVGRAFSHSVPLRRTQRPAGELAQGAEQRKWGILSARRTKDGAARPTLTPWPIERPHDWTAGQPADQPDSGGGDSSQRAASSTVRFGVVAGRASGQARSGVVDPAQRPTAKTTEQGILTPFLS